MNRPLVSIIIPVYNAEKYIAETINSALMQTWPNKELIIIDDGSSDSSLQIANGFEGDNVKIFPQPNKGAAAARNYGINQAKGQYIQFLDADDLLSINKITDQVSLLLENPGKIAVCSTVHFMDGEDPYKGTPSTYEDSFLFDTDQPAEFLINLYGGSNGNASMIQTNAWLTPTNVIKQAGNWSEFYSPDDDGEFFCRVILASQGILYVDNCYNYYRKHVYNHSLAANTNSKALSGIFRSFLLKKENLLAATSDPKAKLALARSAMDQAVNAYLIDKHLSYQLLKVVDELGGIDYVPQLGGKTIEFLKICSVGKLQKQCSHITTVFLEVIICNKW